MTGHPPLKYYSEWLNRFYDEKFHVNQRVLSRKHADLDVFS